MKIIHLTHTDISQDNRIIKELNGLSKYFKNKNIKLHAYGVKNIEKKNSLENRNFDFDFDFTLITNKWKKYRLNQ